MFFMVDFSCSFVSVCKLRKPLGGASSKLRSPHAPPKNPLRWARLAVACRTSVAEGRLTCCSPSAKARRKRLSATACPQQALCPQRGQQPVSRGRRGGARGGEMAFATMNASPPRKNARSQSVPPGKGTPPTAKVRTSDARQCTISSTILSLILSIMPSLVYYKKHTSNLLTLKSESGILWSS